MIRAVYGKRPLRAAYTKRDEGLPRPGTDDGNDEGETDTDRDGRERGWPDRADDEEEFDG